MTWQGMVWHDMAGQVGYLYFHNVAPSFAYHVQMWTELSVCNSVSRTTPNKKQRRTTDYMKQKDY